MCMTFLALAKLLGFLLNAKDNYIHALHFKNWLLFNFLLTLQKLSLVFDLESLSQFFIKFKDHCNNPKRLCTFLLCAHCMIILCAIIGARETQKRNGVFLGELVNSLMVKGKYFLKLVRRQHRREETSAEPILVENCVGKWYISNL